MSRDTRLTHPRGRTSPPAPNTRRVAPPGLIASAVAAVFLLSSFWAPLAAQSLRGSANSLAIQNQMAHQHNYTYLATTAQLERFVTAGYLVPVRGNRDFRVHHNVSFPYAREGVRTFLTRLGRQYRSACGEQLVVTSLARPQSRQPYNASSESVHPTGMAVDLRTSRRSRCRNWLENVLLTLERQGVLEATREYHPPHYHIAVFPEPYVQYVASLTDGEEASPVSSAPEASEVAEAPAAPSDPGDADYRRYQVKAGDSLWQIARSAGVTVDTLRAANGLSSERIRPGQQLRIPQAGIEVAANGSDYRVQPGDSLWEIARSAGVSVLDLRVANDLSSEHIKPGQQLRIPEPGVYVAASGLDYQVQPGDSLWEIAQAHSTSVDRIRLENGLRSDGIRPGQVLTVPAGQ